MPSPADVGDRSGRHAADFAVVEQRLDQHTTVISVEGELDLSSAPQLKWRLVDALEQEQTALVVDLAGVTFMDSTALGVLVGVRRGLDPGARLGIVCTDPNVLNVFRMSGLDAAFAIFRTRDGALAYARGEEAPRS
jgi:anti-sigma B factor antagonist